MNGESITRFLCVQMVSMFLFGALATVYCEPTAAAKQDVRGLKSPGSSGPTCLLASSRRQGTIDRVTLKLDCGGELKFVEDNKITREKMSVVAELHYSEKTLASACDLPETDGVDERITPKPRQSATVQGTTAQDSTAGPSAKDGTDASGESDAALRSLRHYDRAEAVIKVGNSGFKPTLPDDRRLIAVEAGNELAVFSPLGPLSREQLDLLEVKGDSLLLDRLLPGRPVAQGDAWEHSPALLKTLLGLDEIARCSVTSKLETLSPATAMIVMSGQVEGAVGGVSTRMDVKAKYRFLRKTGRIDWFGLLVKEDRDIGHIDAGFELVARVQMQIKTAGDEKQFSQEMLRGLSLQPTEETTQLIYRSPSGGWEFLHSRRWFVTAERSSHAVLRLVDRGELIAQCNITALSNVKPGEQLTLEQFQHDVKEALGESFTEFVTASQTANEANYRVLRVVAGGESSQLPVRWIYYLIADRHGRQVSLTFTVEQSLVERLAHADRAVAATLRFSDAAVAQKNPDASTR